MPLPDPIFYPPFNITRANHICLKVADVARSRAFYETILGLVTTASDSRCAYLRGVEEACHHSLVLTEEAAAAACRYLGFRVLTDRELELAERWFAEASVSTQWMERPYQGHTLVVSNGAGFPAEFCASMEVQPRLFTDPAYSTAPARRLDHFQLLHPRVEEACEFYAKIGFRGSEYVEDADGLVGAFMYRKGNTHDLVFFSGEGPRLHHFAYTVADRSAILHACDLAGAAGYGANIERGPGRHGMDGAYYIYLRDPDGHRVELFDGHYQTIDSELAPRRWRVPESVQPWGLPGQRSWYLEGSNFEGIACERPSKERSQATLEDYLINRMK